MAESKWIPITERLPEKSEDYLITYEYIGFIGVITAWFIASDKVFDVPREFKILAWQPFPEPYKPEQTEA